MQTMITAHSGCDGTPDNSAEFIKTAATLGVDALEVDVNRGKDGEFYLRHDPDPAGEYRGCTTLKEAFQLVRVYPELKLNCDLKAPGFEIGVFHLAQTVGAQDQLIYSGTVGPDFLQNRTGDAARVEIFLNIEEILQVPMKSLVEQALTCPRRVLEIAGKAAECCRRYHVGALNTHYRMCTDEFVRVLGEEAVAISAWTVNEEADVLRLLAKGVRNITTRMARNAVALRNRYYQSINVF